MVKEKEDAYNEQKEEMQKAETLNRLEHWKLCDESIFENAMSFNCSYSSKIDEKKIWMRNYFH